MVNMFQDINLLTFQISMNPKYKRKINSQINWIKINGKSKINHKKRMIFLKGWMAIKKEWMMILMKIMISKMSQ